MTGNYYTCLEPSIMKQMVIGAEYVAFYHAKFFLQALLQAIAPGNDLRYIKIAITLANDKELANRYSGLAQAFLDSTWYLFPELIGLALADDDMEVDSCFSILRKILEFEVPEDFDKEIANPLVHLDINTKLEDLVNGKSYLLFVAMGYNVLDLKELLASKFDFLPLSITF